MSTRHAKDAPRASSLTAEEEALWDHVTKGVKPARGKARVQKASPAADRAIERRLASAKAPAEAQGRAKPAPARQDARPGPAPAPLDRRSTRRIAAGRIEIDARIDLHGMRQTEAHRALRSFLERSRADGCRTVLIITGKGGPLRGTSSEPTDATGRDRGVLKTNVPRWLAEPELSALIIGFTAAHVRHGGAGALYVTLRRK